MDNEASRLMKMAGVVRTGGKGSMRRKKKVVHKTTTTDDKRLQSTLKRIGVNAIPSIEEVNIFKDETIIQFLNPKVQASIGANTWVVSGSPQIKMTMVCAALPFDAEIDTLHSNSVQHMFSYMFTKNLDNIDDSYISYNHGEADLSHDHHQADTENITLFDRFDSHQTNAGHFNQCER
ncbi:hypothetical protein L1987_60317 [Smallanthus sonchifolius]|uniref:Uncharacterized protein n=1 Tax=Smallanthus sonchifolius TaxID=185202 RepID=A0ACB9D7M6_9ASTR|nr:hypothetical protein L1987_60317 [Smallanthus sonchifolius]